MCGPAVRFPGVVILPGEVGRSPALVEEQQGSRVAILPGEVGQVYDTGIGPRRPVVLSSSRGRSMVWPFLATQEALAGASIHGALGLSENGGPLTYAVGRQKRPACPGHLRSRASERPLSQALNFWLRVCSSFVML